MSCRIASIVTAQCDMARPLAERKHIDLVCDLSDRRLPPLRQDHAKLQQILNNLLSNAIKFTPEGGPDHGPLPAGKNQPAPVINEGGRRGRRRGVARR